MTTASTNATVDIKPLSSEQIKSMIDSDWEIKREDLEIFKDGSLNVSHLKSFCETFLAYFTDIDLERDLYISRMLKGIFGSYSKDLLIAVDHKDEAAFYQVAQKIASAANVALSEEIKVTVSTDSSNSVSQQAQTQAEAPKTEQETSVVVAGTAANELQVIDVDFTEKDAFDFASMIKSALKMDVDKVKEALLNIDPEDVENIIIPEIFKSIPVNTNVKIDKKVIKMIRLLMRDKEIKAVVDLFTPHLVRYLNDNVPNWKGATGIVVDLAKELLSTKPATDKPAAKPDQKSEAKPEQKQQNQAPQDNQEAQPQQPIHQPVQPTQVVAQTGAANSIGFNPMDFVKGAPNRVEPNILGNIYASQVPQQPAPAPQAHAPQTGTNLLKQYAAMHIGVPYPQKLIDICNSHMSGIKQHIENTVGAVDSFETASKTVAALEKEADRFMNAQVTDEAKSLMAKIFIDAIAEADKISYSFFEKEKPQPISLEETEAIKKEQAELDEMMAGLKKSIRFRKEYHKNGLTRNEMAALQKFVGASANKKFIKTLKANGVTGELTLKEVFNGRTKDGFDTAFRVKGSESDMTATLFLNMKSYKGKNMPKYELKFEASK